MPRFTGVFHHRKFYSRVRTSKRLKATCETCRRPTRRSPITGILHDDCYACRHLKMVYGPSISVRYYPEG